ncbi:short subunit dehydrogenase [Hungatella effluvii]|uniref:Short subunit dehydrogenase n=1 Tax=Hungatella effluvii TaxID=1096246 RepID=A0A2V3Y8X6_9FIRM|nr:SDR family NAD(P)-dependent oxidoreductase [Hungatella effluvii]PXX54269.1 short subunit dehydrogenase [Hungatella effluvii]
MEKTIIIIGSGKGLGNHIGKKFGHNGFHVILMARNRAALEEYQQEFVSEDIKCDIYPVDTSDFQGLSTALKNVREKYGTPDTLVYNVGVTDADADHDITAELLMERYRVDVAGCYQAVKEIVTDEFCDRKGTILVTGGRLSINPEFTYLPLSLDKAALRSLCMIMKEELEPKGVHVGTVMVCGGIKPGTYFAPENIAEKFWELYQNRELFEIRYEKVTE